MKEKSIKELGFPLVLKKIEGCALGNDGVKALQGFSFLTEKADLAERQGKVGAFCRLLGSPTIELPVSFDDISPVFDILDNPLRSLDGSLMYSVANYIESAKVLHTFCTSTLENNEQLPPIKDLLGDQIDPLLISLSMEIQAVLENSGQVKESHPAIRALKQKVEGAKQDRSRFSHEFITTNNALVQSDQGAFRDGRLVIPVRNDRRTEVKGFINSASTSGNTVFMEPYRLVEMNNAVVMAENQILVEIAKILSELNGKIKCRAYELRKLQKQVSFADALYAIARYAVLTQASATDLSSNKCNLLGARHPLLGSKAVPINVSLDDKVKAVVITGPNAGGKTVTIKTVGLLSLLNQFTGYIPALEGSSLPLFDDIYTDIGDEQSIEESLSTFSGHMKQVGFILQHMTDRSLIILDELGSGTDPVEGASLARATLEYCIEKAKLSFVTSHHGVLKQFAYAKDSVINASMEFDENSHHPTFRVINGIPGDSHALDTARAMNLPKEVVDKAQQYLGSEAIQIGEIIKGLERKKQDADLRERHIEERYTALQQQVRDIQLKELKLRQESLLLKEEQASQLARFMRDKRKELENLVADLRTGEITREKTKKVKAYVSSLEDKHALTESQIESEKGMIEPHRQAGHIQFKEQMDVLCGTAKREGRIIRRAAKDSWIVAIGTMKFTMKEQDLSLPKRDKKKVKVLYQSDAPMPKMVIDVRGMNLEETLAALDGQIESALVHGMTTFSVIHGFGDGILSRGIGDYLKKHPRVSDFRFALPEDGGMGKTYIML
ncbi:mismatch repair ATPase (MutS family) [Sphaerochaeta pleomorpha str. Grapes]|uniref:Endonuclease MutS2 n=1 Tax=Sphaerochaeta pleomorpha (strain ATCC BAA-1885 / DSM 22778 / Grapes) TaxID=158190 RepID=G8QVG0_SPHPG|nr:Smr/MutS family protein [Sphaerochaeta pleomorpha]AEV28193.1 mismatch repair ATPase (MutS family) [Sphaerochaeta pleomorpha str. Grapes]